MKPQVFLKAIGYKIRVIRMSKKLSQEKLAEMSNLHPTFISNLENGKLNGSILSFYRIAQALDTPLSRIISSLDNKPTTSTRPKNSKASAKKKKADAFGVAS